MTPELSRIIYNAAGFFQILITAVLIGQVSSFGKQYQSSRALLRLMWAILFGTAGFLFAHNQTSPAVFIYSSQFLSIPLSCLFPWFITDFYGYILEWKPWKSNKVRAAFFSIPLLQIGCVIFFPRLYWSDISYTASGWYSQMNWMYYMTFFYIALAGTANLYATFLYLRRKGPNYRGIIVLLFGGLFTLVNSVLFNGVLQICYPDFPKLGIIAPLFFPICGFIALRLDKDIFTVDQALVEIGKLREAEQKLHHSYEILESRVEERTKELNHARMEAVRASRAKGDFLANMSHEIRTPLNCILGMAEIITRGGEKTNLTEFGVKISSESLKLRDILNQVLDMSKIEAGKMELRNNPFSLESICKSIESTFSTSMKNKGLQFAIRIADDVPRALIGDGLRLRQVLINMLGNAQKFTQQGGVSVFINLIEKTHETVRLQFAVQDTGIGIAGDKIDTIFNTFEQADNTIGVNYGGTGLGMSISRDIVRLLGGNITVESEPGKGTRFTFTAIFKIDSAHNSLKENPQIKVTYQNIQNRAKVLLVEDYQINRDIALHHLEQAGCTSLCAENGQQAVDMVEKESFDLILMDVRMPVLNGLDAARLIRKIPGREKVPIIGMTANAFDSDREDCLNAGMNDFLPKPFTHAAFLDIICKHTGTESLSIPTGNTQPPEENSVSVILDLQSFVESMGGGIALCRELTVKFAENLTEHLCSLHQALNTGDTETASREAHTIKSGAKNVKAPFLADAAFRLESSIKNGNNNLRSLLTEVEIECRKVQDFVKNW